MAFQGNARASKGSFRESRRWSLCGRLPFMVSGREAGTGARGPGVALPPSAPHLDALSTQQAFSSRPSPASPLICLKQVRPRGSVLPRITLLKAVSEPAISSNIGLIVEIPRCDTPCRPNWHGPLNAGRFASFSPSCLNSGAKTGRFKNAIPKSSDFRPMPIET
jgi:hypothetical protein